MIPLRLLCRRSSAPNTGDERRPGPTATVTPTSATAWRHRCHRHESRAPIASSTTATSRVAWWPLPWPWAQPRLRATRWPLPQHPDRRRHGRRRPNAFVDGSNISGSVDRYARSSPLHPSRTSACTARRVANGVGLRSGTRRARGPPDATRCSSSRPRAVWAVGVRLRWGVLACRHRHRPTRSGRRSTPSPTGVVTDA